MKEDMASARKKNMVGVGELMKDLRSSMLVARHVGDLIERGGKATVRPSVLQSPAFLLGSSGGPRPGLEVA